MTGLVAEMLASRERENNRYGIPSDDILAQMSWDALLELRKQYDGDKEAQNRLAPFEHRAYAREAVMAEPIRAGIGQSIMIPLYTLAKAAGIQSGRSDPSLKEIIQGYAGVGDGLISLGPKP
ncbi:hypothetical protein [Chitinimonas naiadis]